MKIIKRDIVIGVISICLIFILIFWSKISMNWYEKTCAKILFIERSRGYHVWMRFERNNKIVKDKVLLTSFKYNKLIDLQQKECCEIKYSVYWPYNIEIIDDDLKAE